MQSSTTPAFTPPAWAFALLIRLPKPSKPPNDSALNASPAPSATHRAQPSPNAMRELIVQWLMHMRDDPTLNLARSRRRNSASRSLFCRIRAWIGVALRLPVARALPSARSPKPPLITATTTTAVKAPRREEKKPPRKQRRGEANAVQREVAGVIVQQSQSNVSPLYQSLYFSQRLNGQVPTQCEQQRSLHEVPSVISGIREQSCVMPFFLVESDNEGRGILERLKEMHSTERDRPSGPLAWVPAVVSFALIALNPLK